LSSFFLFCTHHKTGDFLLTKRRESSLQQQQQKQKKLFRSFTWSFDMRNNNSPSFIAPLSFLN
jgi:hypothetical protein